MKKIVSSFVKKVNELTGEEFTPKEVVYTSIVTIIAILVLSINL